MISLYKGILRHIKLILACRVTRPHLNRAVIYKEERDNRQYTDTDLGIDSSMGIALTCVIASNVAV